MTPDYSLLEKYGLWTFLIVFAIKEFAPVIRTILEKVIPDRIKRHRTQEEKLLDMEEREQDIRERTLTVHEQQTKVLILLESNQARIRESIGELKESIGDIDTDVSTLLNGVGILLDRNLRFRKGDMIVGKSEQEKLIVDDKIVDDKGEKK